jgi:uncharacterized protein involved in exopolysaccharide biosynthesis
MRTIWNRRWWILTTTLAVLAATLWWANNLQRVYESAVVLGYSSNTSDSQVLSQATVSEVTKRLGAEEQLRTLVDSDLFKGQRATGKTTEAIISNLTRSMAVDSVGGSSLRIRFRDPSPDRAQQVTENLGGLVEKLNLQGGTFKVQQRASVAAGQIMPNRVKLTVFGIGAGVLLGLVVAGLVELTRKFRSGKLAHNPGQ